MELSLKELMERVIDKYDPDELVDMLRISSRELLEAFPCKFRKFRENFAQDEEPEEDYLEEDS